MFNMIAGGNNSLRLDACSHLSYGEIEFTAVLCEWIIATHLHEF